MIPAVRLTPGVSRRCSLSAMAAFKFGESSKTSENPMPAKQDAISLLKADHRKVEELFEKYERARSRKADIARQICMELTIHTMIEEEIFYPACREAGAKSDIMDEA